MSKAATPEKNLTDAAVKALPAPASGNKIFYDGEIKGFGVRVTAAGARAFILNYRSKGRERRYTIGSCSDWTVTAARKRAKALKQDIDTGADPMGDLEKERAAPTMGDLADRFEKEHLTKRRPTTRRDYGAIIRRHIRPTLGELKVAEVSHTDCERLHAKIALGAPYLANRCASVLSKMFNLAVKWGMRSDNPVRGIERAPEERRERFLTPAEISVLAGVLGGYERQTANAIWLLALTGARRSEVLGAKWSEFDLEAGAWTKLATGTKQKKLHRVPLSAAAIAMLKKMRDEVKGSNSQAEYLFPSLERGPNKEIQPIKDIKKAWNTVCKLAGFGKSIPKLDAKGKPVLDKKGAPVFVWKSNVRLHDLRHSFASILASDGLSLQIIGQLLGHSQPATTARYSHLLDSTLRQAMERVGALVLPRRETEATDQ